MSYFFTRMASLEINESLANSIRDRLIGAGLPKEHAVIGQARWNTPVRELDKPRTLWTLYNAYTEYFTRTDTPRMDELNTLTTDVFMKLAA
jgi:hypothetical protein